MWRDKTRLLIVDDDERLTEAVVRFLSRSGYELRTTHSGELALLELDRFQPDLVVLDVILPGMDGWDTCRRIREVSTVPIIILTARDQESDTVMGLRIGADDYVAKPFSLKELEARIEAVLRRVRMSPPTALGVLYDDGHLRLESTGMQVYLDRQPVKFTRTERRLLFALAEQPNRILSLDQILTQVWGAECKGQHNYVKLYIWRLRQKLEPDPDNPAYIRTERGLGYRFVPGTVDSG